MPWIVSSFVRPDLCSAESSRGTLCKSPWSSHCVAFSFPVLCPANFSCLGFLALSSIFPNQGEYHTLPVFPFFCKLPYLRACCPSLPIIQYLKNHCLKKKKNHCFIYFIDFLVLSGGRAHPACVFLSWLEAEAFLLYFPLYTGRVIFWCLQWRTLGETLPCKINVKIKWKNTYNCSGQRPALNKCSVNVDVLVSLCCGNKQPPHLSDLQ